MSTDAQPVASSATAEPSAPPDLATLTSGQRDEWLRTGTVSTKPSDEAPADSSPATPVEQAASTDATPPPASEPGTPPKKGKGVEARTKELDSEIQTLQEKLKLRRTLREELDSLGVAPKPDVQPAASSPAPAIPKFPEFATWSESYPDRSYEDYIDARQLHNFRSLQAYEQRSQQEQRESQERIERHNAYVARFQAAQAADPDFKDKISPEVGHLRPRVEWKPNEAVTSEMVLGEEIYQSPVAPQLMIYLSEHPDELKTLTGLKDYAAVVRGVARLSAKFDTSPEPARPAVTPPKTVTDAPPPPPVLTPRAEVPTDETVAAIASGDFRRYFAAANAKEVSARR